MKGAGGKGKPNRTSFKPGNPGKPKGAVSFEKRKLAAACRELVEKNASTHFEQLFTDEHPSVQLMKVRQDAIEWAAERGYGRAPLSVKLGGKIDPDSPEGVLLRIAGQNLPGAEKNDDEDFEDGNN
jgi:hypothetical protein